MISLEGAVITPTLFPDRTSQVWKVPEEALASVEKRGEADITWEFESEAEFLHLAQLRTLLEQYRPAVCRLLMPYLPYARQDKHVSNSSTFALHTFAALLNTLRFAEVRVLDAHSNVWANKIDNLVDESPREHIQQAILDSDADMLLFPDVGAETRYLAYAFHNARGRALEWVTATKRRNQSTGVVEGFSIGGQKPLRGRRVLMVDDICDGGRTFVEAAEVLRNAGVKSVGLYITHGLFTKGLSPLREAGIKRIWTYKGEVL